MLLLTLAFWCTFSVSSAELGDELDELETSTSFPVSDPGHTLVKRKLWNPSKDQEPDYIFPESIVCALVNYPLYTIYWKSEDLKRQAHLAHGIRDGIYARDFKSDEIRAKNLPISYWLRWKVDDYWKTTVKVGNQLVPKVVQRIWFVDLQLRQDDTTIPYSFCEYNMTQGQKPYRDDDHLLVPVEPGYHYPPPPGYKPHNPVK